MERIITLNSFGTNSLIQLQSYSLFLYSVTIQSILSEKSLASFGTSFEEWKPKTKYLTITKFSVAMKDRGNSFFLLS